MDAQLTKGGEREVGAPPQHLASSAAVDAAGPGEHRVVGDQAGVEAAEGHAVFGVAGACWKTPILHLFVVERAIKGYTSKRTSICSRDTPTYPFFYPEKEGEEGQATSRPHLSSNFPFSS